MAPSSASRLRPALGDHPGGSIFSIAVTCPALGDHPGGSVLGIAVICPLQETTLVAPSSASQTRL